MRVLVRIEVKVRIEGGVVEWWDVGEENLC